MADGIGTRLRAVRRARGLTQKEIAEPRFSSAYVSTIEAGRRRPSSAALSHFASKLGIDPDELATGRPADLEPRLELSIAEARSLLFSGKVQEAESLLASVRSEAARHGAAALEARALESLGRIEERRGHLNDATALYDEAIELLWEEPPTLSTEAIAGKARCVQMNGDVRYAIHLLESHIDRLKRESLQDPLALMRLQSSLVWPYLEVGLNEKASVAANTALELEARVENPEQVASMHMNVARELLRRGRPQQALDSLRKAEGLYDLLDYQTEVARAHINRGIVLRERGDLDAARAELLSAVDTFERTEMRLEWARSLNELARLERLAGHEELAKRLLHKAIDALRDSAMPELGLAYRELALCDFESDPNRAEKHLLTAVDLFGRCDQDIQLAETYRWLGDLRSSRGDDDAARTTYREGLLLVTGRS